ncbi:MAG: RIP metalloprotease RseP [Pelagimonas sp.]|nr:RIP metalloprotease RseP [Pelagimonas sp.]
MDLTSLISQFGGFIWTFVFFVVALSVIIAIHEYGHYIVGKKSGIYPEVFSLGFGPVLWSTYDGDGTKWQIAAIPFGGYVKFRGDANASGGPGAVDEEVMNSLSKEERRSTMEGAPLWARMATVAAGPAFNFILAFVIFTGLALYKGVISEPLSVGSLYTMPTEQGLQVGDEILEIEGTPMPSLSDPLAYETFLSNLPVVPSLTYKVLRDGDEQLVTGPYVYPPVVKGIAPLSAAEEAGFVAGDVIVAVDGQEIVAFDQLKSRVEAAEGTAVALKVWRAGEVLDLSLTPRRMDEPQPEGGFKTVYRIGIYGGILFEPATQTPGFFEAMNNAVAQIGVMTKTLLSALWHIVAGEISRCNMNGAIGIAKVSGSVASTGAVNFIGLIASLSVGIGLLNLLPIPVLDGGHLMFYSYEAITGRPPHEKVLRFLTMIGLVVVLGLMIFGLTNDLTC